MIYTGRMKIGHILFLLAMLFAGVLPGSAKTHQGKIRVLIVDGFSNHDWQRNTQLLRGILAEAHEFTVEVSTAPQETGSAAWKAWRPRFSAYDVVIQTCNDNGGNGLLQGLKQKPEWPEAVKKEFAEYVRKGGGVYIYHSAENAFVGWKEYEQMVGLSWRNADYGTAIRVDDNGALVRIPAGEGRGTGHGLRADVLVTRLGDDPIHAGMPRAWLSTDMEVYYYARGPAERVQVLTYGRDTNPKLGLLWPLEWTTTYGKGRVYISTYGHVWPNEAPTPGLQDAAVLTIIPRALEWLAKRPVTYPIPADFPGTSAVSVRGKAPSAR
jgi:type 1 glutamine amidotransferase